MLACSAVDRSPSSASMSAQAGTPEADANHVVAKWEGGQLTTADLEEQVGAELRQMDVQHQLKRYEFQLQALDSVVDQMLLDDEMASGGYSTVDELLAVEIEAKAVDPSDDEVVAAYAQVSGQVPGASLETMRPYIVQELRQQQMSEMYRSYMLQLREKVQLKRDFPYPDLPRVDVVIGDGDPVQGPLDAPVTLVQFAEYQCFFCNKVADTVDQLVEAYPGKIRVVFKDFPLQNHGRAVPAAVAAHCAGDQDKYWPYNRLLLDNQGALEDADLVGYARQLSLDVDAFNECADTRKYEQRVYDAMEQGRELGVQATPTFFVNGLLLSGAQPYERFASLVEREIALSEAK